MAALAVISGCKEEDQSTVAQQLVAAVLQYHLQTCYVEPQHLWMGPSQADGEGVPVGAINLLAAILDAVALSSQPKLRCVPLLRQTGWGPDSIAALPDVSVLVVVPQSQQSQPEPDPQQQEQQHPSAHATTTTAPSAHSSQLGDAAAAGHRPTAAAAILHALNSRRPAGVPPLSLAGAPAPTHGSQPRDTANPGASELSEGATTTIAGAAVSVQQPHLSGASAPPPAAPRNPQHAYDTLVDGLPVAPSALLRFERVAVGGTFDRLHAADALLAKKAHRELLQPYEQRRDAALGYLAAVRPGLELSSGPLSDPKEPTLAELDPAMDALVVSVETTAGGEAINAGRRARGFKPLVVITVPVIGARPAGGKLSSTDLRAYDAAAAAAAGAAGPGAAQNATA